MNFHRLPFLRILPPVAAGIAVVWGSGIPAWIVWTALAAVYAGAWLTVRKGAAGNVYAWAALMLTAMALTRTHATPRTLPEGERLQLHVAVTDNPVRKGRWDTATAEVGYWRDTAWHRTRQKVMLSVDTGYHIRPGTQMICNACVNPLAGPGDSASAGYARLMRVRGYTGRVYAGPGALAARSPHTAVTPRTLACRMQSGAAERLSRLDLDPEAEGIVTAIATGRRSDIPRPLRDAYARTGTSHLLAVSGLHVGIVFGLVNLLLYFIPVFRRGHVAKNLIAIAAIWVYAAMTGLSPSATRAALMFTGGQLALASTLHRSGLNVMLATAAVMLLLWPQNLCDVSFQLSFAAVLAIAVMYKPMYDRLRTRYKPVNAFAAVFIVGVAATVGTWPLVAHYFGNFPLIGIFVNPPVILTSHVLLLASLLWVILPAGALSGAAGWVIGGIADVQDRIIEWCAALPWAAAEVHLSAGATLAVYAGYIMILAALSLRPRRRRAVLEEG